MSATPTPSRAASSTSSDLPVRLFFALWPDTETVRVLTQWAHRAQTTCGGRIMRPDTLHLTLGFLGDTPAERVAPLIHETRTRRIEPGMVILSRFGAFPRPRIVWAGPEGNGQPTHGRPTNNQPPIGEQQVNGQPDSARSDPDQTDEGMARLTAEHRELWSWVRPLHPARPEPHFRPHVTLLRNADTHELPAPPPLPITWRYNRYVLVASTQDGSARYCILASTRT